MTLSKAFLGEALARIKKETRPRTNFTGNERDLVLYDDLSAEHIAARFVERLLPEKCEKCSGLSVRTAKDPYAICPSCHGTGQLWDEGLVEVVAKTLYEHWIADGPDDWLLLIEAERSVFRSMADAVLAALAAEAGK